MEQMLCTLPYLTVIDKHIVVCMEKKNKLRGDKCDYNASNITNKGSPLNKSQEKEDMQLNTTEIKKQMEIVGVGLAIMISKNEKCGSLTLSMEKKHHMAVKKNNERH
eukprot:14138145-Ditylum_brightwellii.AAC.1